MRLINRAVDRVVTLIQKGMYHSSTDKNESQDEFDAAEINVSDVKNSLDAEKVDESNVRVIVV